jgi:predicted ATPase with chaperone activity
MSRRVRANWWPLNVKLSCSVCFMALGEWSLAELAGVWRSAIQCQRCGTQNILARDLSDHVEHASAPPDSDNPPGRAEAFDAIVGNPVLRRAIEIALAGYHTLTVVGRIEDSWAQVKQILGDRAVRATKCPCGHYGHAVGVCKCTLPEIEKWQSSRAFQEAQAADIIVETYSPKPEEFWADFEPWTSVLGRIRKFRLLTGFGGGASFEYRKREGRFSKLDETYSMVHAAQVRFDWGTAQLKSVQMVARTIATLDRATVVGPAHMAEAISFRLPLID